MKTVLVLLSWVLLSLTMAHAAEPTFAGEWDTTYGRMSLKVDGTKITGVYRYGNEPDNTIQGTQDGRKFAFTYSEPSVTGEGNFTVSEDGKSFDGQWRPAGREAWGRWSGRRAAPVVRDFSGVWHTSYGPMRLTQKGDKVEGCYSFAGRATVEGTVKDGALALSYREPDGTKGKADFQLSADRQSFSGTWKPDSGVGGKWRGQRIEPQPGRVWLVVLEARWEASLRDAEYSYGEMLRQFFTRVPTVEVRHRFFTGRADFAKWCAELPYLCEPVIFYVSSHGTEKGITVGGEVLDGAFIGGQLRDAPDIKLIHLGACLTMAGATPMEIRKASGLAAPVSGFTHTADWAGSAVIDFTYLDLVLSRKMPPAEAVRQVKENILFAREEKKEGSAIAPAGLKIVE